MSESTKTAKGERTRRRILDAALELFREQGFDATTMRQVASAAGVSVGNAYYYFASKEHLVQGFYARTDQEHQEVCAPLLERERGLRERLEGVMIAKIETAEPYHRFAGLLFKTAADPSSPLNPFSPESKETRDSAVELMRTVIEGSGARVHADLRDALPRLFWLYEMAIVLFWLHDASPDRARTRRLIEHTARLVTRLVTLAGMPLLGPVRKATLRLLEDLEPDAGDVAADVSTQGAR